MHTSRIMLPHVYKTCRNTVNMSADMSARNIFGASGRYVYSRHCQLSCTVEELKGLVTPSLTLPNHYFLSHFLPLNAAHRHSNKDDDDIHKIKEFGHQLTRKLKKKWNFLNLLLQTTLESL